MDRWLLAALAVSASVAVIQTARLAWAGVGRRWRLRRRWARARRGERDAEVWLRRAGFRVVGRQVRAELSYEIDGAPTAVEVRADLLVERAGRRLVAEVKTGKRAPRPTHVETRRQLLEYSHAFDTDGLLLVNAERGTIHEIRVPEKAREGSDRGSWLLVGFVGGATLVGWWLGA